MQPLDAAIGAYFLDVSPPAEKSAKLKQTAQKNILTLSRIFIKIKTLEYQGEKQYVYN